MRPALTTIAALPALLILPLATACSAVSPDEVARAVGERLVSGQLYDEQFRTAYWLQPFPRDAHAAQCSYEEANHKLVENRFVHGEYLVQNTESQHVKIVKVLGWKQGEALPLVFTLTLSDLSANGDWKVGQFTWEAQGVVVVTTAERPVTVEPAAKP